MDRRADEQEIRDLVTRYADAATRLDAEGVAGTFAVDGVWVAEGFGRHEGRDHLVGFNRGMLTGWSAFVQVLPSPHSNDDFQVGNVSNLIWPSSLIKKRFCVHM